MEKESSVPHGSEAISGTAVEILSATVKWYSVGVIKRILFVYSFPG
jgi:hypothetical protein